MKTFILQRDVDSSGVSGTGKVAEGVQFSNGLVVLEWLSDHPSTEHWLSMDDLIWAHGHGGLTKVIWTSKDE